MGRRRARVETQSCVDTGLHGADLGGLDGFVDATGSIDDLKDSYVKRIVRKYGTKPAWADVAAKRLKHWGFNTLAEYASTYIMPTKNKYGHGGIPTKLPYVVLMRPSFYGLRNKWDFAPGPFKDPPERPARPVAYSDSSLSVTSAGPATPSVGQNVPPSRSSTASTLIPRRSSVSRSCVARSR